MLPFAPLVYLVVRALITAKAPRQRGLWATRALLVVLCFVMLLRPGLTGSATQTVTTNTDIYLYLHHGLHRRRRLGDGEQRIDGIREDVAELVTQ